MLSPKTKFCHRSLPTRRRTMRFGRLLLACLACGARGYTAPARPGSSRIARSHGPAMGPTLPPMPPMPEGLPRLDAGWHRQPTAASRAAVRLPSRVCLISFSRILRYHWTQCPAAPPPPPAAARAGVDRRVFWQKKGRGLLRSTVFVSFT